MTKHEILEHGTLSPISSNLEGKRVVVFNCVTEVGYQFVVDTITRENFRRYWSDFGYYLSGVSDTAPKLRFKYRNHRGEVSERTVFPIKVYFGSTEFYQDTWILAAWDFDRQELREFSMELING